MILGISYNIFDGEELLKFSVKTMRPCVNYISVVYQDLSNLGNPISESIFPLLSELKRDGLIDEIIKYVPNLALKGHGNEVAKRNIGLESCINAGCSHFMTMDCDEFYKNDEFEHAKNVIISEGYETTACQMKTYYKTPEYIITPPETYYVPFISKLDSRRFGMGISWPSPISADPTRRLKSDKLFAFSREKLEMHHMSYVRTNIRAKLNNSSASVNWKSRIEEMAKYHDDWVPGKKALLAGSVERFYDTQKILNHFEINI